MKSRTLIYILPFLLAALWTADAHGQKYPERSHIRSGNRQYVKGDYADSETDYLRALEKEPDSYEARFNLGNALYKQGRFEQAAEIFQRLGREGQKSVNTANSHYNAGNALFQQRKLQEALEEYKEALRLNPEDMEAKFNYAYTKKLLEQDDEDNDQDDNQDEDQNDDQDDGGGDGQDDRDQDGDNDGDGDQDQDQDQDQDDNGDGKDDNKNNNNKPDAGQQPRPSGMSREEAEQLLQAMQMNEDKTREKVDAEEAKAATAGARNKW